MNESDKPEEFLLPNNSKTFFRKVSIENLFLRVLLPFLIYE